MSKNYAIYSFEEGNDLSGKSLDHEYKYRVLREVPTVSDWRTDLNLREALGEEGHEYVLFLNQAFRRTMTTAVSGNVIVAYANYMLAVLGDDPLTDDETGVLSMFYANVDTWRYGYDFEAFLYDPMSNLDALNKLLRSGLVRIAVPVTEEDFMSSDPSGFVYYPLTWREF